MIRLLTILSILCLSGCSKIGNFFSGYRADIVAESITHDQDFKGFWHDYQGLLNQVATKLEYSGEDGSYYHTAIDYQKLAESQDLRAKLEAQQAKLANTHLPTVKRSLLAFWINAYNFFTLVDMANNYPAKSFKEIGWSDKHHIVAGEAYSLDQIEDSILRKLDDPRIHFAINRASSSCPSIRSEAYKVEDIDSELDAAVANSLRNPIHISIKKNFWGSEYISLSKIFDWYKEDFEDITAFVHKYAPLKYGEYNNYRATKKYNWKLNSLENISKLN